MLHSDPSDPLILCCSIARFEYVGGVNSKALLSGCTLDMEDHRHLSLVSFWDSAHRSLVSGNFFCVMKRKMKRLVSQSPERTHHASRRAITTSLRTNIR
jgi:hypothetical protein